MAETTRTGVGDFLGEVRDEIKKVTWPDQEQLKESTLVILVFMLIVTAVIWVMDQGVNIVLSLITSLFGG